MAKLTENSAKVLDYLKGINGKDVTSADVAAALGLEKRSVDGIFTGLQRKGLGVRIPAEIEMADGSHQSIKLLQLTEAGVNYVDEEE